MKSKKVHGRTWIVVASAMLLWVAGAGSVSAQLVDTDHILKFYWTKPPADNDVVAYNVFYSVDDGANWVLAQTVEASQDTTYYTLQLEQDAQVMVRVQAVDIAGHEGPLSPASEAVISDTAPPGTPGQPVYVSD